MDKAKTMIQMVCSIVALPANSATDRLEIAINFFVNLNKASKAWLLAVPANLMPIAKAAVKKVYLKDSICCCQLQKKVNIKKDKDFFREIVIPPILINGFSHIINGILNFTGKIFFSFFA